LVFFLGFCVVWGWYNTDSWWFCGCMVVFDAGVSACVGVFV